MKNSWKKRQLLICLEAILLRKYLSLNSSIGTLEEIISEDNAIISMGSSEYYVRILSIVDKEQLELGCSVLLRPDGIKNNLII
jgi:ATP-dependent 26S proteasome regulatory subunit